MLEEALKYARQVVVGEPEQKFLMNLRRKRGSLVMIGFSMTASMSFFSPKLLSAKQLQHNDKTRWLAHQI
ncbi:MAG: hypothetical protein KKE64_04450 [Candidatus Omnitrophica bacterium]|nr:hypothetical protein [Candidatus Omnitrophota bacterium]